LGRSECSNGYLDHPRTRCTIHRRIRLHFARSSQGGCLLGGFLPAHARQRRHVLHPVLIMTERFEVDLMMINLYLHLHIYNPRKLNTAEEHTHMNERMNESMALTTMEPK
jgi:hypothetical protein